MQATRQCILEILKAEGEATVGELVAELVARSGEITAVTVRYHLDILKSEGLIDKARVQRRQTPGRPQDVYTLTERAHVHFPKNYQALTTHILEEIKQNLPPEQVHTIMESVAQRMAQEVEPVPEDPRHLMARAADYLSDKGYQASWECAGDGVYLLHINNCPYRQVAGSHSELCAMDAKLITNILGTQLGCAGTIAQGHDCCTYKAQLIGQSR
ncbi:MAG: ArsR family transcriptional regulator [Anaerolineae bacterium]|nr:ArsR family transcriptional regulator [Anaerolineae bacterium]